MKIGLNVQPLTGPQVRGWARYAVNLASGLCRRGVELVLYAREPIRDEYLAQLPAGQAHVHHSPPGLQHLVWEQLWLPWAIRQDRINIFHSPYNFGLPLIASVPRVLTLHDAIDAVVRAANPDAHRSWTSRKVDWQQRVARLAADRVITLSEHARGDLVRWYDLDPSRISVIHEAADERFHADVPQVARDEVRRRYALDRPYLLYLGGYEKRKNVPFLLRAFAQAGPTSTVLTLAGGSPNDREAMVTLSQELRIEDRVRALGYVEDDDLPALYAEALCYVYPSEYEGFGLQLCEALATGCPTLAARATSLPEVLGEGGETFALDSCCELAGLLDRISRDPEFRSRLSLMAKRRARDFSWDKTVEATLSVYQDLAKR